MSAVVMYGNPKDGFGIVGPFDTYEAANEYADQNVREEDWWTVELERPYHYGPEHVSEVLDRIIAPSGRAGAYPYSCSVHDVSFTSHAHWLLHLEGEHPLSE